MDDTKRVAVQAMERRMLHDEPWTFQELQAIAHQHGEHWRTADALIQKWRRKGWAAFRRVGRSTFWTATETAPRNGNAT